jgi:hypothetical protein
LIASVNQQKSIGPSSVTLDTFYEESPAGYEPLKQVDVQELRRRSGGSPQRWPAFYISERHRTWSWLNVPDFVRKLSIAKLVALFEDPYYKRGSAKISTFVVSIASAQWEVA